MVITKTKKHPTKKRKKTEKEKQINYIQKDSSHLSLKIKENPFS